MEGENDMKASQNARLLNWLETHQNGISTLEAVEHLRILRVSERARELAALGYVLSHTPETTSAGARIMRYRLVAKPEIYSLPGSVAVERKPMGPIYSSVVNDPTTWDAPPMVEA